MPLWQCSRRLRAQKREEAPQGARHVQISKRNTHTKGSESKMMNTMMNGGMGLMMLGMFLGTTLWILLLTVLIWALITWLNRRQNTSQPRQESLEPSALSVREILSQRYVRGEIDQATFQQMREQLGATSPS